MWLLSIAECSAVRSRTQMPPQDPARNVRESKMPRGHGNPDST